jgi:stress response protein YsnF
MPDDTGKSRIPIVEERARVDKHLIPTARVRITSRVEERVEVVREELTAQTVAVERVPINREVDSPPVIRTEGDVLIIPIVEERLVVEKRWVVTEELRVRRREHAEAVEIPVQLRATSVSVERTEAAQQSDPPPESDHTAIKVE